MPRKSEPSFYLKTIIWKVAATVGTGNWSAAMYRDINRKLEQLHDKGELLEDIPTDRKIRDIVESDIQRLDPEVVVAKLPSYVWHLRTDYETLKQLAKESVESKKQGFEQSHGTPDQSISESDFLMQQKVVKVLRNAGYTTVRTNRGFFDPENKKSRRYDIYAHKEINVYGLGSYGIYPTIVCECKNNLEPASFFIDYNIDDEDFRPLIDEVMVSGIPSKIWKRNKYISIQEFINVLKIHHFCKPVAPVATHNLNTEWDLTKALESEIDNDFKNMSEWLIPEELGKEFIDLSFYYPLVIYKGEIYGTSVTGKTGSANNLIPKKLNHIQYNPELYSFYYDEVTSYHVDIISEGYLPEFLKIIEIEMTKIKDVLKEEKKIVMQSTDQIVAECLSLEKKPNTYRRYLEYPFP